MYTVIIITAAQVPAYDCACRDALHTLQYSAHVELYVVIPQGLSPGLDNNGTLDLCKSTPQ